MRKILILWFIGASLFAQNYGDFSTVYSNKLVLKDSIVDSIYQGTILNDVEVDRRITNSLDTLIVTADTAEFARNVEKADGAFNVTGVLSTDGNIDAGGNIETTADILADDDITATNGDITATNGSITAGGDITTDYGIISSVNGNVSAGNELSGYYLIANEADVNIEIYNTATNQPLFINDSLKVAGGAQFEEDVFIGGDLLLTNPFDSISSNYVQANRAMVDTFMFNDSTKIYYVDSDRDEIYFASGNGQAHLNFKKSNLYGVLPVDSATATITTVAGTLYFIQGNFVNKYSVDFGADGDTIQYLGADSTLFDGTLKASVTSGTNNTTLSFGVYINDTACLGCTSGDVIISSSGDDKSVTIPFEVALNKNDKIKLLVQSNKSGASITFNTITAKLIEIGRLR